MCALIKSNILSRRHAYDVPSTMNRPLIALVPCLLLLSCGGMSPSNQPPATTAKVDLKRYIGRWHEIARLPMPFQNVDESAVAEYGSIPDGTISVHNIATRRDGSQHDIRGTATVLNPGENTRLAVRFSNWFGPLIPVPQEGNYWILDVDAGYQHAIVGTPDRKYLWFLSRTKTVSQEQMTAMEAKARSLGFDLTRLIRTPQY